MSGVELSREEILVLDKGIKYALKKGLNKFDTYVGVQKLVRKLNIKKYYALNPVERTITNHRFTSLTLS